MHLPAARVLLLSVDGLHAVDLANWVAGHPKSALAELTEFVRVGVQLVFAELEPVRGHSSVVDGLLH